MYICVRCKEESKIPGFCQKCYYEIYNIKESDIIHNYRLSRIKVNDLNITKALTDSYGTVVHGSVGQKGMVNPLILNQDKHLLIGYHRLSSLRERGIEYEKVVIKTLGLESMASFTEGVSDWLYVGRLNGELAFSVCRLIDISAFFDRMRSIDKNQKKYEKDFNFEIEAFYLPPP